MRAFFGKRESRQMAVFKGGQRLFRAALAAVTLVCWLPRSSAAERAQHKPHQGVTTGGFLDAEEINKIVRECGSRNLREEALKKLRDAYANQKMAALQLAIAICLEHGQEGDRKDALKEYSAAANAPYSDPIDGMWARRRREYLSDMPARPPDDGVREPPPSAPPPSTASRPAATPPASSVPGDPRNGTEISNQPAGSNQPATEAAPSVSPPPTQPPGLVPGPEASAQPRPPPPEPAPKVAPKSPPSSTATNSGFLSRMPAKRKVAAGVLGGLLVAALIPTVALLVTDGQYTTVLSCGETTLPCRLQNKPLYVGGFVLSSALAVGIGLTFLWPLPKPGSPMSPAATTPKEGK